jgi:hypothetical protein
MDYLHACYTATGRWGPGPTDTFTMRWYHCSPAAKEYPYGHAFGTTVDTGCQNDDSTLVGEIPPVFREWSPSLPWLYDGTSEPVYNAALEFGADPAVMAVPCSEGNMVFQGTAKIVALLTGGNVCQCETVPNTGVIA